MKYFLIFAFFKAKCIIIFLSKKKEMFIQACARLQVYEAQEAGT